jgi:glycerol uptake facilitator-like aquaporin
MKKYLAEMIGTMVLVLIGCGSAVISGGQVGFLGIAFAFGLAVLAMAYTIEHLLREELALKMRECILCFRLSEL